MKLLKMFGLAAVAALMAMAFVGASSAMATDPTSLCDTDPGTGAHAVCPATHLVKHVHEETLTGQLAQLVTSVATITCDVLFLGDVTTAGLLSKPPAASLAIAGNFTYTNCETTSGTPCTVTEVSKGVTIEVLKLAHELADVTGKGEVNAKCGKIIDCTYNGTGLKGHGLGPLLTGDKEDGTGEPNGETRLESQATTKTGGLFCPKTSTLSILTTPLTATYITE